MLMRGSLAAVGPGLRGARHRTALRLWLGRASRGPVGADPLAPSGLPGGSCAMPPHVQIFQRRRMGEGPLRENLRAATPSPDNARCSTELPSPARGPARGEGANARAPLLATARSHVE